MQHWQGVLGRVPDAKFYFFLFTSFVFARRHGLDNFFRKGFLICFEAYGHEAREGGRKITLVNEELGRERRFNAFRFYLDGYCPMPEKER